ncbi:MAG: hypothetical protein R3183_02980 [Oleiphilaceae bacterium]|nr:hypothetical protein [Oleiphilaceae bacterium]
MSSLPSHLIKMRVLSELPKHYYAGNMPSPRSLREEKARHSFLKFLRQSKPEAPSQVIQTKQTLRFNVAAWLEFAEAPEKPVSLWLLCEDAKGSHAELIDEQASSDASAMMLSGDVTVSSRGAISSIKICCAGLDDRSRFRVSDIHVKVIEQEQQRKAG